MKPRNLDGKTPFAFAYNNTINKSTRYSPFFLMFRQSSKLPVDSIFDVQNSPNNQKSW